MRQSQGNVSRLSIALSTVYVYTSYGPYITSLQLEYNRLACARSPSRRIYPNLPQHYIVDQNDDQLKSLPQPTLSKQPTSTTMSFWLLSRQRCASSIIFSHSARFLHAVPSLRSGGTREGHMKENISPPLKKNWVCTRVKTSIPLQAPSN